jgi:predicted ATPase/DNA-binding SARP family transcriptional activator
MSIRFEMLGGARIALSDDTFRPVKATVRGHALAYLALSGDWVTRDRIGFLFWADSPDSTARHNVRQLLKRIRQLGWIEGLETSGDAVRWLVPHDVADLTELIAREDWGDLPQSGDLLPGLERNSTAEFEDWLLDHRRRTLAAWQTAVVASARHAEAQGDPIRSLSLLEPLLDSFDGADVVLAYMEIAVKAGRRDLAVAGFDRVATHLRSELGVEPPAGAVEMMQRLASETSSQSAGSARGGLVGREFELTEITRLLALPDCRLLTVVGVAGIGKSTIAHEVLDRAKSSHVDGASLVSLENVVDPDDVASSIAAGLAISLDARADPVDQLIAVLRERDMLLVLDNAEHLQPAWVVFSRIVDSCPRIQLVITSRERLRLEHEWIYEIAGLREDDAIDLFLKMGRRVAPSVAVSADEARTICHVVGGSPLGLGLAVPWLRVMAASEIAAEIPHDQGMLSGGHRDGPARHQSMAATMKHSWDLASARECEVVEALSVLAAPYTRELADQVGGVTATVLRDLLDQSLVHRRHDGTYLSHPLVRGYAAARLAEDGQRHLEVRRRHAVAILRLVESATDDLTRRALVEDAVVAWQYAVESGAIDLMTPAIEGVTAVMLASARINRGLELLADAAELLRRNTPKQLAPLAATKLGQSELLSVRALHGEAAVAAEEALAAATEAPDELMRVKASLALGWARKWTAGDPAQYRVISEALPVAESLDDCNLVAQVLNGLGCSAPTLLECRDHLQSGLDRVDNQAHHLRAVLLHNLGMVNWALGEDGIAVTHVQAALDIAKSADDRGRIMGGLNSTVRTMSLKSTSSLAFLHADLGDLNTALRLSAEAESLAGASQVLDAKIYALLVAGEIHRLAGDSQGAQVRGHEALTMAAFVGNESFALRALRLHGQLLLDSGDISHGLGTLAFVLIRTAAKGGDFTSEIINPKAWEEAIREIDHPQIEAARAWAEGRDLDDVVELALEAPSGRVDSQAHSL